MLRTLTVRDFVTVESLELDLAAGFTVLTGETGAGKSILIDAIGLLLGDRADVIQIRGQAERAELSAEFIPSGEQASAMAAFLDEAGLDSIEGSVLIRRNIERGGRSRAWINGQPATLAQLKELGEFLVNVHGQHAHQSLLRSGAQRELLDRHARLTELAGSVRQHHQSWQKAMTALKRAQTEASGIAAQLEQINWRMEEITALKLERGEWESLSDEQRRLAHGAELVEAAQQALNEIEEADQSLLSASQRWALRFRGLVDKDPRLDAVAQVLEAAAISLEEAGSELSRYLDRADLDPRRLEEVEARVSAIFEVARKLKLRPEELVDELERLQASREELAQSADLEWLESQTKVLFEKYEKDAKQLSKGRKAAAASLAEAVTQWLGQLAMPGSVFQVQLEARETPSDHGLEDISFLLKHQRSGEGHSLAKVASGGELSRVGLAIAAVAAQATQTPTLIFDEVDAGIGGNTGHVVGRLLRDLGASHQVLAVTHLPQVAARGHQHLQVSKRVLNDQPSSTIRPLAQEERRDEVARMLGDEGTGDRALELAEELLRLAQS